MALLRFSGDPTRPESFHLTFNAFMGGALVLMPIAAMLRTAVKRGERENDEGTKGRYAPLEAGDAGEAP